MDIFVKECVSEGGRPFVLRFESAHPRIDAVLKREGFRSEREIEREKKSTERSKKIRAWVAEKWCDAHNATTESCGCVKTEAEVQAAKEKADERRVALKANVDEKRAALRTTAQEGPTRNALMLKVKEMGVKNFRVMNKEELAEVAGGASADRIEAIQKQAVARWKSGWGAQSRAGAELAGATS